MKIPKILSNLSSWSCRIRGSMAAPSQHRGCPCRPCHRPALPGLWRHHPWHPWRVEFCMSKRSKGKSQGVVYCFYCFLLHTALATQILRGKDVRAVGGTNRDSGEKQGVQRVSDWLSMQCSPAFWKCAEFQHVATTFVLPSGVRWFCFHVVCHYSQFLPFSWHWRQSLSNLFGPLKLQDQDATCQKHPKPEKTSGVLQPLTVIPVYTSIYQSPLKQRKMTKTCAVTCHGHGEVFRGFQAWPSPGPGPGAHGAQWSATTAVAVVAGAFLQQTWTNDILYRLWTDYEEVMYRLCILVTDFLYLHCIQTNYPIVICNCWLCLLLCLRNWLHSDSTDYNKKGRVAIYCKMFFKCMVFLTFPDIQCSSG